MKIAIMGTGGVGGYFGAKLALGGHDVSFIARGAHLEAINAHGLRVESPLGDMHVTNADATASPGEIGPVDVVLIAVKLWDLEAAAEACIPLLNYDTLVLPFQNGITASETVGEVLSTNHVGAGIAKVQAVIAEPGVIRHLKAFASLEFGETDNARSPRLNQFHNACRGCGIDATVPDDISVAIWQKFIFLVAMSGLTAAARSPIGAIFATEEGTRTFLACTREVAAVGLECGVQLSSDIAETITAFAQTHEYATSTSQRADLERGNRLELPWLTGAVCNLARQLGIPTPVNDAIYTVLSPYSMGV